MNRTEHMLIKIAEEASEIVKDAAKAIRFGLADKEPGQDDTNLRRLEREFAQLSELSDMMGLLIRDEDKKASHLKIMKYLEVSRKNGTFVDNEVRGHCPHCGEFVPPGFYHCYGDGSHPAAR